MARQTFIIGRAGDIKLYDDTVSRRHAVLEIDDGSMFLRDLDSRNGTFEIRDKQLHPFTSGPIYPDQVFAFGECVRSVTQLMAAVSGHDEDSAEPADLGDGEPHLLDATLGVYPLPRRQRLSRMDIVAMLEHAEDRLAAGANLEDVCAALGITEQRYQRWCQEHGATRLERERSIALLRQENERLRMEMAEMIRERQALREALARANARLRGEESTSPGGAMLVDDIDD